MTPAALDSNVLFVEIAVILLILGGLFTWLLLRVRPAKTPLQRDVVERVGGVQLQLHPNAARDDDDVPAPHPLAQDDGTSTAPAEVVDEHASETAFERAEREAEERAAAEFASWRDAIRVEASGEQVDGAATATSSSLLHMIKQRGCVRLETLAAEMALRTADVLARVQELQRSGKLSGVLDDRGRFIHVGEDTLVRLKEWIVARGAFTKAELAREVSRLLTLASTQYEEQGVSMPGDSAAT